MEGDEPLWHGYLYAILFLVFPTLQLFFMTQYAHYAQIIGLNVRTALTTAIYRKVSR